MDCSATDGLGDAVDFEVDVDGGLEDLDYLRFTCSSAISPTVNQVISLVDGRNAAEKTSKDLNTSERGSTNKDSIAY